MYPKIFGIFDTYTVCILVGIAISFVAIDFYFKNKHYDRNQIIDFYLVSLAAIILGFVIAVLFENLYEFIEDPENYTFTFGMTFLGGLIGGAAVWMAGYFIYLRKHYKPFMDDVLRIVPAAITLTHAFGRIGCFCAGCCYGVITDSWIGVQFPGMTAKVIPTQLIESLYLFIISGIFLYLAFKTEFRYNMPLYMILYSVFRFVIEFYRGDERGAFVGMFSPSQFICFFMFGGAFVLYLLLKKFLYGKE